MKLHELLLELGNQWYPFELVAHEPEYMEIVSQGLTVYLTGMPNTIIEFAVNGEYNLTGRGNAYRILATVVKILETYLPKMITEETRTVFFGADKSEPSRVKLYQRAVPVIGRILGNDWEYQKDTNSGNSIQTFTWTRKTSPVDENQLDLFSRNKIYYLMIDGKIWVKAGKPVEFQNFKEADRAAQSIIARYGKPAQVVDPDRYPVKYK